MGETIRQSALTNRAPVGPEDCVEDFRWRHEMRTPSLSAACIWSRPNQQIFLARVLHKPILSLSPRLAFPLTRSLTLSHRAISLGFSSSPLSPAPISVPRRALSNTAAAMSSFYSLKATLPGNKTYDFEQLKGKVVLIVNTASKWYAGSVALSVL